MDEGLFEEKERLATGTSPAAHALEVLEKTTDVS